MLSCVAKLLPQSTIALPKFSVSFKDIPVIFANCANAVAASSEDTFVAVPISAITLVNSFKFSTGTPNCPPTAANSFKSFTLIGITSLSPNNPFCNSFNCFSVPSVVFKTDAQLFSKSIAHLEANRPALAIGANDVVISLPASCIFPPTFCILSPMFWSLSPTSVHLVLKDCKLKLSITLLHSCN